MRTDATVSEPARKISERIVAAPNLETAATDFDPNALLFDRRRGPDASLLALLTRDKPLVRRERSFRQQLRLVMLRCH